MYASTFCTNHLSNNSFFQSKPDIYVDIYDDVDVSIGYQTQWNLISNLMHHLISIDTRILHL